MRVHVSVRVFVSVYYSVLKMQIVYIFELRVFVRIFNDTVLIIPQVCTEVINEMIILAIMIHTPK